MKKYFVYFKKQKVVKCKSKIQIWKFDTLTFFHFYCCAFVNSFNCHSFLFASIQIAVAQSLTQPFILFSWLLLQLLHQPDFWLLSRVTFRRCANQASPLESLFSAVAPLIRRASHLESLFYPNDCSGEVINPLSFNQMKWWTSPHSLSTQPSSRWTSHHSRFNIQFYLWFFFSFFFFLGWEKRCLIVSFKYWDEMKNVY